MLSTSVRTKLSPAQAVKLAIGYFGSGGLGLQIENQDSDSVRFCGGGGMVDLVTCSEGKDTLVDIQTHEWENQVREFIVKMPH